ncbi:MAG: hypothetical protein JXL85_05895 [Bacilli bacterium]|nr:hypothetical protein [Bacilli bacterium]
MKKLIIILFAVFISLATMGCNGDDTLATTTKNNEDLGSKIESCEGSSNFVVVDGECIVIDDILSENISLNSDGSISIYNNNIELMDDFVADLDGSVGLAVMPRDTYDATRRTARYNKEDLPFLSETTMTENTENIIVKLTEEGFFEEVDFQTENGETVDITANPLALEVYGDFTVVVFEVNHDYYNEGTDFSQKVYDSLYAGGIYFIHNESGKLFATKTIEYQENIYSYWEDHSRTVNLTVTLNEPVYETQMQERVDDFGDPVLDEFGNIIYDEVQVQILDENGDPLIFTEGPIQTEIQEVPLVEYYEVPVLDEFGNEVIDPETNKPMMEIVEQPVTDENGDPVMVTQEVPVLDEFGNVVYMEQFEVSLFIQDNREITVTEYYANVTDNPLSDIAVKFVDQIMSKYYNWNYYRVQNYIISNWGFGIGEDAIYFMQQKNDNDEVWSNFVIKMSFDSETNELLLEDLLNVTKAGLDNTEIILDPSSGNIISRPYDSSKNMKLYSQTLGLMTIADSDGLYPVTFPNGDLYFYKSQTEYIEELGYYTALLYTIGADGVLNSAYIELGQYDQICYGTCYNSFSPVMLDAEGNVYAQNSGWIAFDAAEGDRMISGAYLQVTSIDTFDSSRPQCQEDWCYYEIIYTIETDEGEVLTTTTSWNQYDPADTPPPYEMTYRMDGDTEIHYQYEPSTTEKVCTNETLGCKNDFYLYDESVNQYGLYLYGSQIISAGENFLERIVVQEGHGTYIYEKEIVGDTCQYETCSEYVQMLIYDLDGEVLSTNTLYLDYSLGETIPLRIEYHITEDTVVTEGSICTSSGGCWRGFYTDDNDYYSIYFNQGDVTYTDLDFAETDITVVTEETVTNDYCVDDYCSYDYPIVYKVQDSSGTILFEFEDYRGVEYGYRLPFEVILTYTEDSTSDVELFYQLEYSSEIMVSSIDNYNAYVSFRIATSNPDQYIDIGYANMFFDTGEQVIYEVIFPEGTLPTSEENNKKCQEDDGCIIYTTNYTVLDELGDEISIDNDYGYYSLPVKFELGDNIPTSDDFHVTFTMSDVTYYTDYISPWNFINQLNDVIILNENLYLIENSSWDQQDYNIILRYDVDSGHYFASYTNLTSLTEITKFNDSYIAINEDQTAIYQFTYNEELSSNDFYWFDSVNLTEGLLINAVNDLIIDYDGSIYFSGVDNFIQDITGTIATDGTVTIDTEVVEREVIRVSPVN